MGRFLMMFKVRRELPEGASPFAHPAEFEAGMKVEFGVVQFGFATNPNGKKPGKNQSPFKLTIVPNQFKAVAQAMMHADSSEAIKAFGAALENGIPESREVWVPGIDDVDPVC
jgi:pyruvate/2-oxoglutarate dehydrogenase complex dihydrolipoamide dehydrogenase (E3) component